MQTALKITGKRKPRTVPYGTDGAGGGLGARFTVVGGARAVRPVIAVAVLAMSGRLLGVY